MTDRLRRERVLPEGYQFGDARIVSNKIAIRFVRQFDIVTDTFQNGSRIGCLKHWSTIEGDPHESEPFYDASLGTKS